MSDQQNTASDLIYQLEDKPPFLQAIIGAVTHLPFSFRWSHRR